MCGTKFLQMCSFSIILTSLNFLNLSFPLLFYVTSTAVLEFPLCPDSPLLFLIFFGYLSRFPAPTFPSHSSHSYTYSLHFHHPIPQFPILAFTDSLLSLQILKFISEKQLLYFQNENSHLLLLHSPRHQVIVFIYDVIIIISKNYLPYNASSKMRNVSN